MNINLSSWQYTLIILIIMALDTLLMVMRVIDSATGFPVIALVAGHFLGVSFSGTNPIVPLTSQIPTKGGDAATTTTPARG